MRRLAFALTLGLAFACRPGSRCDDEGDCDLCRSCSTESGGPCRTAWRACTTDPACDSLVGCADDCWLDLEGADAVFCERTCRGTIGGTALALYDEYLDCVEDACTLSCEW